MKILTPPLLNAYSFAKTFVKEIEPSNKFFTQYVDVIITILFNDKLIVSGGPSAGCFFATILISLALKKPVFQNLAMTGQISSDGIIGKIGGIRQKVGAVVRGGLKNVIVPKANQEDFEALPRRIKEKVTVYYAETYNCF